ncbi:HAMP domain-containing histidine kinase [Bacillus sp. EB106-08-02-XG196]|jgi:signal transduction histidine kinase|uniref:sensor histidine kinase n=1 Tax=Bacillus sp. EB106-08-02-XG196 TaxID=2737049 RepID=UPI0015C4E0D6|nr:HAMP domain-containing sensor histidine kinase [Bacillus sp. EB106-08-02-XG196]NWQ43781.1 HAMP domain-containing histidine kinase [Bacillus sp. EB106-08-02-XG196]
MSRTNYDVRKLYQTNKEKCPFSVSDSIEEALSVFFSILRNQDIHVDFEYRGLQIAYGVPSEFSQIVLHILTSAREAFDRNHIQSRKMKIQICTKEDLIVVKFTDNAGCIDSAQISRLFEPNFTTNEHGTGNGLYITKMIIEKMNGLVKVENTEDGARFSLSIPKFSSENNAAL